MPGFADMTLGAFTAQLADKVPSPGGGAVAAVTLSHAAALGAMVLRYTVGRPSFAAHETANADALARLDALRTEALRLADRDAAAYARLAALWKLPAGHAERERDFPAAIGEAIEAPMTIVRHAAAAAELMHALPARTNARLGSDLAIAAELAGAAADAAAWNVRVNLPSLADRDAAARWAAETDTLVDHARRLAAETVAAVRRGAPC
ncbi:MAG: formiminotransferase-cyclodeaminase [Planctomycetes bacterium]|nr:formiminotransferase-cyclodeaminase [Planctomycetota bacterium]